MISVPEFRYFFAFSLERENRLAYVVSAGRSFEHAAGDYKIPQIAIQTRRATPPAHCQKPTCSGAGILCFTAGILCFTAGILSFTTTSV